VIVIALLVSVVFKNSAPNVGAKVSKAAKSGDFMVWVDGIINHLLASENTGFTIWIVLQSMANKQMMVEI
jgi:hypothetical protein